MPRYVIYLSNLFILKYITSVTNSDPSKFGYFWGCPKYNGPALHTGILLLKMAPHDNQ